MARLWFHIAAITLAADPTAVEVAKSAETVPPLPRTEWQPRQPLPWTSRRPRGALPAVGAQEWIAAGGAAKSAETVPPLPRTEWQPRQPLPWTSRRPRVALPAVWSK